MAIDRNELRRIMGHFATGVTVITTHDGNGKPYGLTANAVCSLSLVAAAHPRVCRQERREPPGVRALAGVRRQHPQRRAARALASLRGLGRGQVRRPPASPRNHRVADPRGRARTRRVPGRGRCTRAGITPSTSATSSSGDAADGQPLLFFRGQLPSSRATPDLPLLAVGNPPTTCRTSGCTCTPSPALAIVILAAGRGTRMRSERAKVLHTVAGRPFIVCRPRRRAAARAGTHWPSSSGHEADEVGASAPPIWCAAARACPLPSRCSVAQRGTGDAVRGGAPVLRGLRGRRAHPLRRRPRSRRVDASAELVAHHRATGARALAPHDDFRRPDRLRPNPSQRGRAASAAIVEERDLDHATRGVREVNPGIYCVASRLPLAGARRACAPTTRRASITSRTSSGWRSSAGEPRRHAAGRRIRARWRASTPARSWRAWRRRFARR